MDEWGRTIGTGTHGSTGARAREPPIGHRVLDVDSQPGIPVHGGDDSFLVIEAHSLSPCHPGNRLITVDIVDQDGVVRFDEYQDVPAPLSFGRTGGPYVTVAGEQPKRRFLRPFVRNYCFGWHAQVGHQTVYKPSGNRILFSRACQPDPMSSRGRVRKPRWLKRQPPAGERFTEITNVLRSYDLNTVCEEASCPNRGECWSGRSGPGTATFMLMGERCSRGCNFCDVATGGMEPLDAEEPTNVAAAVAKIGLEYVVLTSVDRDDLPDQGATHFAETIRKIKAKDPNVHVEALIPDFQGEPDLVADIIESGPTVLAHNVETVDRLQTPVRDPRAGYEQSLDVLEQASSAAQGFVKTSIMLGVGERPHEIYRTLSDLNAIGVDIVTFGQYLQPSRRHLDVERYVHPHEFETWQAVAEEEFDFLYCASGPLVRSSYRAGELFVQNLLEGDSVGQARTNARAAADE